MTHRLRACAAVALAMSACALLPTGLPAPAFAHGVVGKRFFPATLATDDPFVADELSLPTISNQKTAASGDEPATLQTSTSIDFLSASRPIWALESARTTFACRRMAVPCRKDSTT